MSNTLIMGSLDLHVHAQAHVNVHVHVNMCMPGIKKSEILRPLLIKVLRYSYGRCLAAAVRIS